MTVMRFEHVLRFKDLAADSDGAIDVHDCTVVVCATAMSQARRVLCLLSAVCVLGSLIATPADARIGHVFGAELGGDVDQTTGTDVCQAESGDTCQAGVAGTGDGEFSDPTGIAVEASTGDVYVADTGNDRIDKLTASGRFVESWGYGVSDGAERPETCSADCRVGLPGTGPGQLVAPTAVAVDNSVESRDAERGDVYVLDGSRHVVDRFSPSGEFLGEITGISIAEPFGEPIGVAVDTNGKVWVADSADGIVSAFTGTGKYLFSFPDSYGTTRGMAVGANNTVYLVRGRGEIEEWIDAGADGGTPLGEIQAFDAVAVDPVSEYVFGDNESSITEFSPTGEVDPFTGGGLASSGALATGAGASNGSVYATDASLNAVFAFEPTVLPDVATGAASAIRSTTATISGSLTSHVAADYYFEYGTSASYEARTAELAIGADESAVSVTMALTGLQPGTIYHYRLVATGAHGVSYGKDAVLKTNPPVEGVSTGIATALTQTTATLNGSLEPNGVDAHYYFAYGPTTVYSSTTPEVEAGAANGPVPASAFIAGLEPGATYHYRLVAESSLGIAYGADQTFRALPVAPVVGAVEVLDLTPFSATLDSVIDPGNGLTSYHFVYAAEGERAHESQPNGSVSGDAATTVLPTTLQGLAPGTTYHYKLLASNEGGSTTSAEGSFVTLPADSPSVTSVGVEAIGAYSATIVGAIDPDGSATTYDFELAEAAQVAGLRWFGGLGAETALAPVSVNVEGLTPETIYRYRLSATNAAGTVSSLEGAFTTMKSGASVTLFTQFPILAGVVPVSGLRATKPPPKRSSCTRTARSRSKRRPRCERRPRRRGRERRTRH
jgi:DNA-binding beta-propeller fold protein YncE